MKVYFSLSIFIFFQSLAQAESLGSLIAEGYREQSATYKKIKQQIHSQSKQDLVLGELAANSGADEGFLVQLLAQKKED